MGRKGREPTTATAAKAGGALGPMFPPVRTPKSVKVKLLQFFQPWSYSTVVVWRMSKGDASGQECTQGQQKLACSSFSPSVQKPISI